MSLANGTAVRSVRTGYLWDEISNFHNAGYLQNLRLGMEPVKHWENPETKRRMHTLLSVSGVLDHTLPLRPRPATVEELSRVHDPAYISKVQELSLDESKGHFTVGHEGTFAPGGFTVAAAAAGGAIVATDAVLDGKVSNAYVLARPPGHHAERDHGMGFCIFNNIAVAASHALEARGLKRVAIVDYDVHHGNGTQHMFEEDPRVLFISLHQDSNYPLRSGYVHEQGKGPGEGFTINVPLPPGSGEGAYRAAVERVVLPALAAFRPELLLVSSGFDAALFDPLSAMMLGADQFRWMAGKLLEAAGAHCSGRTVFLHEGGYSELYVPYCGLAVLEEMTGHKTGYTDPYAEDVLNWGYQALQPHQDAVVAAAEKVVELLRSRVQQAA